MLSAIPTFIAFLPIPSFAAPPFATSSPAKNRANDRLAVLFRQPDVSGAAAVLPKRAGIVFRAGNAQSVVEMLLRFAESAANLQRNFPHGLYRRLRIATFGSRSTSPERQQ
jgi:hypothetical protein